MERDRCVFTHSCHASAHIHIDIHNANTFSLSLAVSVFYILMTFQYNDFLNKVKSKVILVHKWWHHDEA